jgi:hypothetical protein
VYPLAGQPAIAFGGTRSLITWVDRRATPSAIFGARVNASGGTLVVDDPAGIAIASGGIQRDQPTVAFMPIGSFVVAWGENGDIHGRNLFPSGAFDGPSFPIATLPEREDRPALSRSTDNTAVIIAYDRHVPSLDARQVFARRISFTGTGGQQCSTDAQCQSGFCVDKYCCDVACGGNDLTDCQACSINRGGAANGVCSVITNTDVRCRDYAGDGFCDIREKCDGVNPTCPEDVGRREGQTCNLAGGGTGTCPANDVTGAPHVCEP